MRQLRVGLQEFDLDAFIKEIFEFVNSILMENVDPSYTVASVEDGEPEYGPEDERRDHAQELLEDRKTLFFPFSASNLSETIACADGEEYWPEDWFNEGNFDLLHEDEEFSFGETECLGYLITVEDGKYVIDSAVHGAGTEFSGPYVRREPACGVFDEPMTEFILRFVVE